MLQKARQDDASDPELLELVEVKPLQTDARNGSGIRLLVDGIEIARGCRDSAFLTGRSGS